MLMSMSMVHGCACSGACDCNRHLSAWCGVEQHRTSILEGWLYMAWFDINRIYLASDYSPICIR